MKLTVMEPSVNTADYHCTISEVIVRIGALCGSMPYACVYVRYVCMYVCMCTQ